MSDKKLSDKERHQIWVERCRVKKKYPSQIDALVHASKSMRKGENETVALRAYECKACHFWHLTKKV